MQQLFLKIQFNPHTPPCEEVTPNLTQALEHKLKDPKIINHFKKQIHPAKPGCTNSLSDLNNQPWFKE